jgi:glycosyltransferase involved in cell wall biosynthesis
MRILRLDTNSGGPARPINVGIRAATGDFIAVLDQDDVFAPGRLEGHVTRLAADPGISFVVSCCARLSDGSRVQTDEQVDELARDGQAGRDAVRLSGATLLRILLLRNNILMGYPAFTFRRDLWARRGGVDTSLRMASDYDLLCWLCLQGDVLFLPHTHYHRRLHDRNLSLNGYRMILETFRVRTRYVPACRPLRVAGPDRDALQAEYQASAYAMRRWGCYAGAVAVSLMGFRAWGVTSFPITELLKVVPHMVVSGLTGRHRDEPFWARPRAPASGRCQAVTAPARVEQAGI